MDTVSLTTQALIEDVASRTSSHDPLTLLETAVDVAGQAGAAADAMVDHYVGAARAASVSWTAIGERLGISKQAARQRFFPRLETNGGSAADLATLAPRLVSCLEVAQAAADAEDSMPGTQHLLLGLLHVGVAANVLDRLGVTRDAVREASNRLLEATDDSPVDQRVVGDGEAKAAVLSARRFAASRGQNLTRTEHLLFVLAMDPGSSARRILDDLRVTPAGVKKELDDLIPPPSRQRRRGRRAGKPDLHGRACSFCGCTDADRAMVNGPGVRICGECITLATDILATSQDRG